MTTTLADTDTALETGLDAAAVKPTECDVRAAAGLPFETVIVDYEGREHLPDARTLAELARATGELRVTVPVRADGFDPLGDDSGYDGVPPGVKLVLVAGNPAYLSSTERRRNVAPRLGAAVERATDPWVGTEGIARIAQATGATQFLLLSPTTERDLRGLRALREGGFRGELAVYAPTVLTDDEDVVLNALGPYVGRRRPVRAALPEGTPTDNAARGRAREALYDACGDYGLIGPVPEIRDRVEALKAAGADLVVGYPARGLGEFGV